MDRLKAMANFARIVDSGSLSSAADVTGQSVASLVRSWPLWKVIWAYAC